MYARMAYVCECMYVMCMYQILQLKLVQEAYYSPSHPISQPLYCSLHSFYFSVDVWVHVWGSEWQPVWVGSLLPSIVWVPGLKLRLSGVAKICFSTFNYMCMGVVMCTWVRCLWTSEEGVRTPRVGGSDVWEQPSVCWHLSLGPL